MKTIQIEELINISKIEQLCDDTIEPIYVQSNGNNKLVVMDVSYYEYIAKTINLIKLVIQTQEVKTISKAKVLDDIEKGLKDIQNHQIHNGRKVLKDIREKYRLNDNKGLIKDLNYYLSLNYPMIVTPDPQGGYTIIFKDLPGCITCCEKPEDIIKMANDAKKSWLEASLEDGLKINEPT